MPSRADQLLRQGLDELGLELGAEVQDRLLALAGLLARWAERFNLTAHRSPEAVVRRLVLDALALAECLPEAEVLADLGSGAGFPGLPLALWRPEARVVLVEARERRHHFQRAAIRELGLRNVEARLGRIEALEPTPCDGVIAQALARPDRAVALCRPWCAPGAWLALPGGETAPAPGPVAGIDRHELRRYHVPCDGPARSLWLGWSA